jgi:parvulin-like peptidyl-prolyl isomerase
MDELEKLLVRDYGMNIAQHLVANELVRQRAAHEGITITEADVERQQDEMLKRAFSQFDASISREHLLDQMLAQRGISRGIWDLMMRREAMLSKLTDQQVEVSEEDLRRAFGARYGRKVVVRHIETASLSDAQSVLEKLSGGADFVELARQESMNDSAANGGLLPPIGKDTEEVPSAIRSAALAMHDVGEISEPVQAGTSFHVLKLDRVIPPQNVQFEEVRGELAADLRRSRARAAARQLFHQLMLEALQSDAVQFVNPTLKAQLEEARQQAEELQP